MASTLEQLSVKAAEAGRNIGLLFSTRTNHILESDEKIVELLGLLSEKIKLHPELFAAKFGQFLGYQLTEGGAEIYFDRYRIVPGKPNHLGIQLVAYPSVSFVDGGKEGVHPRVFHTESTTEVESFFEGIFIFHLEANGEFSKGQDGSLSIIKGFRSGALNPTVPTRRRVRDRKN